MENWTQDDAGRFNTERMARGVRRHANDWWLPEGPAERLLKEKILELLTQTIAEFDR